MISKRNCKKFFNGPRDFLKYFGATSRTDINFIFELEYMGKMTIEIIHDDFITIKYLPSNIDCFSSETKLFFPLEIKYFQETIKNMAFEG